MKSLMYACVETLRQVFLREIVENLLVEISTGSKEQAIVACIEDAEDKLGFLMAGEEDYIVDVVQRNLIDGESTKPRGRTPKAKDWQSYIETCKSRVPIYASGWDKGSDGALWLSKPEIVIFKGTWGGKGEWVRLADSWTYLLKKGVSGDTIKAWQSKWIPRQLKDNPTQGPKWTPGYKGFLKTRNWSNWEQPSGFRNRIARAIREDEEEGAAELDILSKIPFRAQDGVEYLQVVFHPEIGDWSEEGMTFRMAMRLLRIPTAISVVRVNDQPADPDVCLCCGRYHPTVLGKTAF